MPDTRLPRAAILAIGDELVLGQRLDTNSQWLSAQLAAHGVTAIEHVTLDDDEAAIARALVRLAPTVGLVLATGGLGPTADDLTRQGLAAAMGQRLIEDPDALAHVEAYFQERGRDVPEGNRVQALRPAGAECLQNPIGTAPALRAMLAGCQVFCLPGPPAEMRPMFDRFVRPVLGGEGSRLPTAVLQTVGLGESEVAGRLAELMDRSRRPLVGTTASGGVVSVRIRGEAGEGMEVAQVADEVGRRLGPTVFAEEDIPLETVLVRLLCDRGESLATVESCTGGMLGERMTGATNASAAYVGGWVTYTNEMKHREVGVPWEVFDRVGAVSRACAEAMAAGGLQRSGATHCLSITGIAGPGGGSKAKPVGTVWIGLASRTLPADVRCFRFPGGREAVRQWSCLMAMAMLRLRCIGHGMPLLGELGAGNAGSEDRP